MKPQTRLQNLSLFGIESADQTTATPCAREAAAISSAGDHQCGVVDGFPPMSG